MGRFYTLKEGIVNIRDCVYFSSKGNPPYRLFSPAVEGRQKIPIFRDASTRLDTVEDACRQDKRNYFSAYTFHVVNNAIPEAWRALEERLQKGNICICDPEQGEGHKEFLARLLNTIKDSPLLDVSQYKNLNEQIDAAVQYRTTLLQEDRKIFDKVITFAYMFSENALKTAFALRVAEKAGIKTKKAEPNKISRFLALSERLRRCISLMRKPEN